MISGWIFAVLLFSAEAGRRHGHKRIDAYIHMARWRRIYCSPGCAANDNARNLHIRCFSHSQHFYNSTSSTTFVDSGQYILMDLRDYRPFYGQKAYDVAEIEAIEYRKAKRNSFLPKMKAVDLSDANIVRGFSFDKRYFTPYTVGLLGLSPAATNDHPSFALFLKSTGQIERAIISIQNTERSDYTAFFAHPQQSIVLGALDKYSCTNWTTYPAYETAGWVFEIGDVRYAGQLWPGRHFARIDLETNFIGIPESVVDPLLAATYFREAPGGALYISPVNRTRARLEFTAGTQSRMVPWNMMARHYTYVRTNGPTRYSDENIWSFGVQLFTHYCFGFDYETRRVAWGDMRNPL